MQIKPILTGLLAAGILAIAAVPLVHAKSPSVPIKDLKMVAEKDGLTATKVTANREEGHRREEHRREEHRREEHRREEHRREYYGHRTRGVSEAASYPSPQVELKE